MARFGVDEPCASGGGLSKARKAQRSIKIKHSHGSDAQIFSGTASGLGCRPIFRWEGAGGFPVVNLRATGVPEGNRGFGG